MRYHLSFQELYSLISRNNMDLSGGKLRNPEKEVLVRTVGEVFTGLELANTVIRYTQNGSTLTLREIAKVRDGFEEDSQYRRFNGKKSVEIIVFKTPEQDALKIAAKVKAFVKKLRRRLPSHLNVEYHSDLSKYIHQRLDLLKRNGITGLILVFASLLLFLNVVLAFWAASGLVVAFLGTFIMMHLFGVSINLISMFALIIVLGMLVDDAIIIGENIYRHMEEGKSAYQAAIDGASEVAIPVTSAILTTIAAFLPLLLMKGQMGQFMRVLPLVVTAALTMSLFEAIVILPSHLAETLNPKKVKRGLEMQLGKKVVGLKWWEKIRAKELYLLNTFGRDSLVWFLRKVLPYRYALVSFVVSVTLVVVVLGYVFVPFVLIQKMDADTFSVNINMPVGTPIEKTQKYLEQIEPFFKDIPEKKHMITLVGAQVQFRMHGFQFTGNTGDKAQIFVELKEPEERKRSSFQIMNYLRKKMERIPGPETVKFQPMTGGPQGKDIEIEIQGDDYQELKKSAEDLKKFLARFKGIHDLGDSFRPGKDEVQITLTQRGKALGFTVQDVASQVRAALRGLEADSFFRDKEEVKVMIKYPPRNRQGKWDVENMRISNAQGKWVYLKEVALLKEGKSLQSIERTDQKRTITVSADVDYSENTPDNIVREVEKDFRPYFEAHYPHLSYRYKGAKLEAKKSMESLKISFIIALVLIYSILASQFGSYIQPIVVMFAIPFGIVGAIVGHLVMGYMLTILSMVGIVALSGIVVNDSLVLVDFINHRRQEGVPLMEAVVQSCYLRMRAILLTSITTILGLAPLMLETSMQARFLIPMAISITFGLAFATFLTLVVVPCFYLIVEDMKRFFQYLLKGTWEESPNSVKEVEEASPKTE
ncbi:MAG: efflux RND transporter permease subunit [Planctomycetota bacterium]|nr:MAG: efflux RND transporter permease subunit [Planctomycetota bacterium]